MVFLTDKWYKESKDFTFLYIKEASNVFSREHELSIFLF